MNSLGGTTKDWKTKMANDAIFLLTEGDKLLEMNESKYDSEDILQSLLENYPELLAGNQMDSDSPRRWLLVSRETPVPTDQSGAGRWALDHLFLDQDGIPTMVEVKRSSDTRIRREVVGQLLDYAANAVLYWPGDDIRNRFETRCEQEQRDCDLVLREFLRGGAEPEQFWMAVKTNLQAERIRMVFVADEIPSELQRIVEFLNGQMDPAEVIAVQIKQYKGEELTTLVPRVVGQTAEAGRKKTRGGRRQWDEASFFADLADRSGSEECTVARKLLEWANASGLETTWGQGKTFGTFYPMVCCRSGDYSLFGVSTSAKIEIVFGSFPDDMLDSRVKLLSRLNSIPGISFPDKAIGTWGSFPISAVREEDRFLELLSAFEQFADDLRRFAPDDAKAQHEPALDGDSAAASSPPMS